MKKILCLPYMFCCLHVCGQFSLQTTAYSQNFNGLINTGISTVLPAGWQLGESGSAANSAYSAGTGSGTTGDTYSFGAIAPSTDRALGGLRSGSLIPAFGFYMTNNTGSTIIGISINYSGETWRVGAANRSDRLDFQYSINATSLTTGVWLDHDPLDYTNPGQATGNGSIQHTANLSSIITGLNIPNGSSFFIRWIDVDAPGSDDGMGVDDLAMNVILAIPTPVNLNNFSGRKEGELNMLQWTTVTESNNRGFEIERSADAAHYNKIGWVNSKSISGNSSEELNYVFVDREPLATGYYRLRQVDIDDHAQVSPIILITRDNSRLLLISNLFPNPARDRFKLVICSTKKEKIMLTIGDMNGKALRQWSVEIDPGNITLEIDVSKLAKGNYFIRLDSENRCEGVVKRFVIQ